MSTLLTTREKSAQFKKRFSLIKDRLSDQKDWKSDFYEKYPAFDKAKWGKHIENVVKGNIAPTEELIKALEKYVKTLGPKEGDEIK